MNKKRCVRVNRTTLLLALAGWGVSLQAEAGRSQPLPLNHSAPLVSLWARDGSTLQPRSPVPAHGSLWHNAVLVQNQALHEAVVQSAQISLPDPQRMKRQSYYQIERRYTEFHAASCLAEKNKQRPALFVDDPLLPHSGTCALSRTQKLGVYLLAYKDPQGVPAGRARMTKESLWVFTLPSDAKQSPSVFYLGSSWREEDDQTVSPEIGGIGFTPAEDAITFYWHRNVYVIALPRRSKE